MERIKDKHKEQLSIFEQQKQEVRRLWNISEKSAELLFMLIKIKDPQHILEIGSSNGYSTFWLSLAAEECEAVVTSLEVDELRYNFAVQNLKGRSNVELIHTKAEEILPNLDYQFDFVFIDAGKINYIDYLIPLISKLKNNAVIVADNVISHYLTVANYLDFIHTDTRFQTMTLPVDAGLEISIFKTGE